MDDPATIVIRALQGLCIASALYALFLVSLNRAYEPKWTWATVAFGHLLIIGAFAYIAAQGVISWWVVLLYAAGSVVAGAPIIGWQIYDHWGRVRRKRNRHQENDR